MKSLIRPAMLIMPLIAGALLPELHFLAAPPYNLIRWALCMMIFINALQIKFSDLKPCVEHGVLLAVNIVIGLGIFFLLKMIFPGDLTVAQSGFFAGIAPTAAASAVVIALLDGNMGFAVTGFIISNIGIAGALLVLLPLVAGNFSVLFFLDVLKSLVITILIPLLAAGIIRRSFPAITANRERLKNLTLCLWSFSLLIIASVARNFFDCHRENPWRLIIVSFVVSLLSSVVNFTTGYWINRRFRAESSQLLGQKNTTFAIYIALEYASGGAALASIFYVLFHNGWNSIQLYLKCRKK